MLSDGSDFISGRHKYAHPFNLNLNNACCSSRGLTSRSLIKRTIVRLISTLGFRIKRNNKVCVTIVCGFKLSAMMQDRTICMLYIRCNFVRIVK